MVIGGLIAKVEAAPGRLDTTFSSNGRQITSFGARSNSAAQAVAVQKDGKIVLVGHVIFSATFDFALARYHDD
jgi:predicted phage tail protein